MDSIEALWAVHFGDAYAPGQLNGGVAILETSRIFGGDSCFYYVGEYEVSGDEVTAQVRINHFSGSNMTAFGIPVAGSLELVLDCLRTDNTIKGHMWRTSEPTDYLPVILQRLENLP